VFFVIICNRFVDSSKCGPHDFDPRPLPSQKIVPARLPIYAAHSLTDQIFLDADYFYVPVVCRLGLLSIPPASPALQPVGLSRSDR